MAPRHDTVHKSLTGFALGVGAASRFGKMFKLMGGSAGRSASREMGDRYLRIVLLSDGETVHNAFFDRGFEP